jgi:flagellar assembly protein FliH
MMILPSENTATKSIAHTPGVRMPARLLGGGRREVSRLEFLPLEPPEIEVEVETDETTVLLKEELDALDGRLQSQTDRITADLEMARTVATATARLEWEEELGARIGEERAGIVRACEEFVAARARYFAGVEAEVVKLALAIAARVLHREAKLDPLLLAGVVRVALGKVAEDSATVLRVPVSAVEGWQEVFAGNSTSSPQIVGDEQLGDGECVLDTKVGKVELGVNAQLQEIERGFFDLMQQRPM